MRKLLLLSAILICGATACPAQGQGQEEGRTVATFYYDEEIPGIVWGVSDNGQWAVGYDDQLTYAAFIWNKDEKKFVDVFGLGEDGEMAEGVEAQLYDVADDGTAVGIYQDMRTGRFYPGTYKDGTWTQLSTFLDEATGRSAYAAVISPDGTLIGGMASTEMIERDDVLPGQVINAPGPKVPVLWRNGEIERYDDAEYLGQGVWINDMNADGTMLCGYAEWDDGSRSPAVWKDGAMVRLVGTEPATSNPDKWTEFYEGQMYCFNADATMAAGYFSEGMYGDTYGIVWDIPETFSQETAGEVAETNTLLAAGGKDGRFFGGGMSGGAATVYENGEVSSFLSYYGITDNPRTPAAINAVSTDETLFGTSLIYTTSMGATQCPMVICFETENDSSIDAEASSNEAAIHYAHNVVRVAGNYNGLSVYNMGGQCLMQESATDGTLDLSALGSGVYLVKVKGDNYTKLRKVIVE